MSKPMTATPLMRQYLEIKQRFPEALVLFQVGDFYEFFYDDAKKAAAFLGITLTKRGYSDGEPIPLCGVPVHMVEQYLLRLVRGGFRAVLVNQTSLPQPGKMVDRAVAQVFTPSTLTDSVLLDEKTTAYCAVLIPGTGQYALLCTEILTGALFATIISDEVTLFSELARFAPAEIVLPAHVTSTALDTRLRAAGYVTTLFAVPELVHDEVQHWMSKFPAEQAAWITSLELMRRATTLLFSFLSKNSPTARDLIMGCSVYSVDDVLMLDAATQRNLELVKNAHDGLVKNSLFEVLDRAITPMGSRRIYQWIARPLMRQETIEQRLDAIQQLVSSLMLREEIMAQLTLIGDLERCVGRIALRRGVHRDYCGLLRAIEVVPRITQILECTKILPQSLPDFHELAQYLRVFLNTDSTKEWIIAAGCNPELDRLRELVDHGSQKILAFELREQERTGISSLKVRFNAVQGYAIEITKANLDRVPIDYIRLQSLSNREKFTTQELKDLEYDLQRAHRESTTLEQELFAHVIAEVAIHLPHLRLLAERLAILDAYVGLATVAYEHGYVRPQFTQTRDIVIRDGKHPVVMRRLGHAFIPNDCFLTAQESLWIITGPNMGGKSTFLRQTALIIIMAQMGSFVPVREAYLPIVDRIFTRIGAADNVAEGKSTFFVEMEETALICNQATEKSLVILDEVGRGTSTYDGLAIAQAVLEYVYATVKARCLFATHYHELTALCERHPGIVAYHAASKRSDDTILLLHKIIRGTAHGSFGIDVARAAHLPDQIVERAQEILRDLHQKAAKETSVVSSPPVRLKEIEAQNPHLPEIYAVLRSVNIEDTTPRAAHELLRTLQRQMSQ